MKDNFIKIKLSKEKKKSLNKFSKHFSWSQFKEVVLFIIFSFLFFCFNSKFSFSFLAFICLFCFYTISFLSLICKQILAPGAQFVFFFTHLDKPYRLSLFWGNLRKQQKKKLLRKLDIYHLSWNSQNIQQPLPNFFYFSFLEIMWSENLQKFAYYNCPQNWSIFSYVQRICALKYS